MKRWDIKNWDVKTRRMYVVGLLFVFASSLMVLFEKSVWSLAHRGLFAGTRGFLLGLGVVLLLWVVVKGRRSCRQDETAK